MAHTFNANTWDKEAGRSGWGQPGLYRSSGSAKATETSPIFKKKKKKLK